MDFFVNNITITLFLPLWICLIILSGMIFKFPQSKKTTVFYTVLSTFICLIFSLGILNTSKTVIEKNIPWIQCDELIIYLGTLIDDKSTIFLVILMIISLLVQIYSYGYMKDKEDFNKYYIYLNFFNFSMAGLLLSSNIIQTYLFWELVGIASYLLIGFYYKEEAISNSAKKVFFINRIGDFCFLAGIITLTYFSLIYENELYTKLLFFSNIEVLKTYLITITSEQQYNFIIGLFLIGAFIKSAQFPFHTWLIDAMKAPTPVSALIHSSTMVCMGIFLIVRIYSLLTEELKTFIFIVGLITAIFCAFTAFSQNNIKKILAYSTSSQLGLMFFLLGIGTIPQAILYLVIHSFTKALLFLSSGSISNAFNSLEISKMGGLKKQDFYLALYWLIGALSLSGLFFGGFVSKEILVYFAHEITNTTTLFIILLTSFFTTQYIFKIYFQVFEGENKIINKTRDKSMSIALLIMSVFVIIPITLFNFSKLNLIGFIAILINIFGVLCAYFSYKCNKLPIPKQILNIAENEFYITAFYNKVGNIFLKICTFTALFDKYIIDNFVNFTATISQNLSNTISKIQTGNIQSYISYSILIIGLVIFIFTFITIGGR